MLAVPAEVFLREKTTVDAVSKLSRAGAAELRASPGTMRVIRRAVIGDFRVRGTLVHVEGAPTGRNLNFGDAILEGPGFSSAGFEITVDEQIAAASLRLNRDDSGAQAH
ncbi:MAG: hypothetical protein BWY63_03590 [Chloroflexi bacterium ADurb.Bin360]|nr:MAG: hypothetical protein BWY63_03590 [Chloroflexi bacterium ADurb.Bin360]